MRSTSRRGGIILAAITIMGALGPVGWPVLPVAAAAPDPILDVELEVDTVRVGATATLTARVFDTDGTTPLTGPAANTQVRFRFLSGSPNDPSGGGNADLSCHTGQSGMCTVSYVATVAGTDEICARTTSGNGACTEAVGALERVDAWDTVRRTIVETREPTPTPTPTADPPTEATPTAAPTPTTEPAPTAEPGLTAEPAPTAEPSLTAEPTTTPTPTTEPTHTAEPAPTAEPSLTAAPSTTAERTAEPTTEATPIAEPSLTAEPSTTVEPTPEPSLTPEPTPTAEPTTTPEPTTEPTTEPTAEPTTEPKPTAEPSLTAEPTATPTTLSTPVPSLATEPTTESTPTPEPTTEPTPTPTPSATPTSTPSDRAAPKGAAIVAPRSGGQPPSGGADTAMSPERGPVETVLGAILGVVQDAAGTIRPEAAIAVATTFGFPLALTLLVLLFLLVQSRLDDREPKLRTAMRSQGDQFVGFEDDPS